ncbi:ATP-dependent DNA helicase PIF1 [Lentinula edodes]|uniref:ATP-dependent DNA helicase PIF1 n=1 Tax=Lentinula edodes TaxID=5353 RepID=A0A1Q3ESV9_LENED|nr:ATP-dependent DNA helicase PIF1 [Lentinula edodes]
MWVGAIPFELRILTLPERVLVSRFFAAAYIVKLYPKKQGGRSLPVDLLTSGLKGNVSSYFLNTQEIAGMVDEGFLPPRPSILAATIAVTFIGPKNVPLKALAPMLAVRRRRVADALRWLIANNPLYAGIEISEQNLSLLPEDGVPVEIWGNVKWSDQVMLLEKEHAGYVNEHNDGEGIEDGDLTEDDYAYGISPMEDEEDEEVDEDPNDKGGATMDIFFT